MKELIKQNVFMVKVMMFALVAIAVLMSIGFGTVYGLMFVGVNQWVATVIAFFLVFNLTANMDKVSKFMPQYK